MNSLKNIRENLGLNQEDLAVYLNISRSLIAAVETNRKELPTPALLKLTALYQSLPQNIAAENLPLLATELSTQKNKLSNFLQENATKNLLQALLLKKKLMAMQNNYAASLKLLQGIRTIQKNLSNTKENKRDVLWLAAIEATTLDKIKANDLVQQKILELKIEQLNYVAETNETI